MEWFAVIDRNPPDNKHVLTWCQWRNVEGGAGFPRIHLFSRGAFDVADDYMVTHWATIDHPPQCLVRCPFCGNRFIKMREYQNDTGGSWFSAECMSCEATGPSEGTASKAASGWNKRSEIERC